MSRRNCAIGMALVGQRTEKSEALWPHGLIGFRCIGILDNPIT